MFSLCSRIDLEKLRGSVCNGVLNAVPKTAQKLQEVISEDLSSISMEEDETSKDVKGSKYCEKESPGM